MGFHDDMVAGAARLDTEVGNARRERCCMELRKAIFWIVKVAMNGQRSLVQIGKIEDF